jgi:hypothetical protein
VEVALSRQAQEAGRLWCARVEEHGTRSGMIHLLVLARQTRTSAREVVRRRLAAWRRGRQGHTHTTISTLLSPQVQAAASTRPQVNVAHLAAPTSTSSFTPKMQAIAMGYKALFF